jgi:HEAT repeat protein
VTTFDSVDIDALLGQLGRGDHLAASDVAAFADLSGADLDAVRDGWPRLPEESREWLMRTAAELAEDDALLDFVKLACVAASDPSSTIRELAAGTLWETEDRHVVPVLLGLLDDSDEEVRGAAAVSLGHFVQAVELDRLRPEVCEQIVDGMRRRADDPDEGPYVRSRVIESLGSLGEPWVTDLIEDAFNDEDRDLRLGALRAMGASARDDWNQYVLESLTSDDPETRFVAAIAAGEIASDELTDTVALLLNDEDTDVAFAAIRALGEIGGAAAVRYLEDFGRGAGAAMEEEIAEAIEEAKFNGIEVELD